MMWEIGDLVYSSYLQMKGEVTYVFQGLSQSVEVEFSNGERSRYDYEGFPVAIGSGGVLRRTSIVKIGTLTGHKLGKFYR